MTKRHYPNWLQAFADYTQHTEAPAHFHLWTGMFAIAATLGRNTWLDMHAFEWIPNQYVVLVGEPGIVTKSTSIRIAEELVRLTEKVRFGANSSTWQALAEEMRKATSANMSTGTPQSPLSLVVSELGSFLDLENREQVDFMTDIWDGQKGIWKRNTKGGGEVKIEAPCLNLIAATTPNWIRQNFKQGAVGGGLSSRMILVLGKQKRNLIPYPNLRGSGTRLEMKDKLVEDLKRIAELEGPMELTSQAYEWGTAWYESHIRRPDARQLKGERFAGYYARKQTHMHKIAMILSAATSDTLRVTERHLKAANGILLDMEREYGEVLEHVQTGSMYSSAKLDLARIIKSHPNGIEEKLLYREVASLLSGYDFKRALQDLLKADEIRVVVGGSSTLYTINKYSNYGTSSMPEDVQNERERPDC